MDTFTSNRTNYGILTRNVKYLHQFLTKNLLLICLLFPSVYERCFSSPVCCSKSDYFEQFFLNSECRFSICNSNKSFWNVCISCTPRSITDNYNSSYAFSSVNMTKPYAVCKDYQINNRTLSGRVVISWPWLYENISPFIFIIEARNFSQKIGEWEFIGMTNETFADVSNLDLRFDYQFRISPLSSHQNIVPSVTDWILLRNNPDKSIPTNIKITDFSVKDNLVEATVKWNAFRDSPCSYAVHLLSSFDGEYLQQRTVILPQDSLSVGFSGLAFERNYTVSIFTYNFQDLRKPYSADIWFITPSCFNLTGSNFSICAPGSPLNLHAEWLPSATELLITWFPPAHTSSQNEVISYHISIEEISGLPESAILYKNILTVGKNITSVTIPNLKSSVYYIIEVWAFSKGGRGSPAIIDLPAMDASAKYLTGYQIPYHYIIPAALVFFLIVIILVAQPIFSKKNLKGFPSGVADVDGSMRKCLIPVDKIYLGEIVGQGAFAVVHKGILTRNKIKEDVAVKVFPAESINRRNMLHEIEVLQLIGRHDNVIGFIGFTLDIEKMYLVFEYCTYGNLHNFLIRLKPQFLYMINLPPSQRPNTDLGRGYGLQLAAYILQVAKGMEYISSLKLIHRDIAARNILMYSGTRVKIGDFGLSKDVYETKNYYSITRKKLPVKWMAPEAIEKQKFNTFTDVWAFGVFMWEVFKLGKEPYPDIKSSDILQFLKMGYRLEQPYCTEEWYEIMRACWKKEPKSRPGFKEIVHKIELLLDSDHVYTVLG